MLRDRLGLDHFEGRSFIGWHHHVTLVSVAAATKSTSNSAVGEVGEPIPAR